MYNAIYIDYFQAYQAAAGKIKVLQDLPFYGVRLAKSGLELDWSINYDLITLLKTKEFKSI